MLRILVIDELHAHAAELCVGLISAGHQVAGVLSSVLDLEARVAEIAPDVILIETAAPSRDTLASLAALDRAAPRPVIIFAQEGDAQAICSAMKAGVCAYVVDGFEISRLKPIIEVASARFKEQQALKQELAAATRKLSERKVVDKAKGILMRNRGLDEEQAYAALRKLAMERAKPMAVVAQDLLDMAKLLL